jgi:hypothetical protein
MGRDDSKCLKGSLPAFRNSPTGWVKTVNWRQLCNNCSASTDKETIFGRLGNGIFFRPRSLFWFPESNKRKKDLRHGYFEKIMTFPEKGHYAYQLVDALQVSGGSLPFIAGQHGKHFQ